LERGSVSTYLKLELLSPVAPVAEYPRGRRVSTYLKLELLSLRKRDGAGGDGSRVSTYLKLELLSLGSFRYWRRIRSTRFHLFEAGAFVTQSRFIQWPSAGRVSTYLKLELLSPGPRGDDGRDGRRAFPPI